MRKRLATLGGVTFFCVAPGTVAGVLPWLLTRWRMHTPFEPYLPVRLLSMLLLGAGVLYLVRAFVRFVVEGLGTPAPVAPTALLVVGGIYRYVRNPMYLAIVAVILGQALLLGQPVLFWYGLGVGVLQAAFVHLYEEANLRARFGAEYEEYRRAVPAWWPRLRPWSPPER